MTARATIVQRKTKETAIEVEISLDGSGQTDIQSGLGFLDHMLDALMRHSRMDLRLVCKGDLEIDDHHTSEDCAIVLGQAINKALGPRKAIRRFGSAYAPLDKALVRAVVDLSNRPLAIVNMDFKRERIGQWATENIVHFFRSLATSMGATLHLDTLRAENDHHQAEAAFKALALALKNAVTEEADEQVPSTKGVL